MVKVDFQSGQSGLSKWSKWTFKVDKTTKRQNTLSANMVMPHQYLIKTKSFITNLIEEGRLDEANQLLELGSKGLVQHSNSNERVIPLHCTCQIV